MPGPALKRSGWKEGIFSLACAAIWNGTVSFLVMWVVRGEMPWFARVGLGLFATPFVLAGLALIWVAFYFLFRRRETLHDSSRGTMWQQDSLFGVQSCQRVVARKQVLAMAVDPAPMPLSPPSVVALALPPTPV